MMKVLDLTKTIVHTSKRDPDYGKPGETKFTLGAIPSRIYTLLKDKATMYADLQSNDGGKVQLRNNSLARDCVKYGLKSIENFPVEVKFDKEHMGDKEYRVVAEETLDVFDIDLIRELHAEIEKLNEFTEEEAKNSEG